MSSTSSTISKHIEDTRSFIRTILTGEVTPETHPGLFAEGEDPLFHALAFLQMNDRAWLEAQLADEGYPLDARELVRRNIPEVYISDGR